MRSERAYRVNLRKIRFDRRALREIRRKTACPPVCKNSIISIANVVVQGNINQFGAAAMARLQHVYSRIEGSASCPSPASRWR